MTFEAPALNPKEPKPLRGEIIMAETRKEHNTAPVKENPASALKALEDEVRAFIDSNFDSLTERQKAKLRVLLGVLTLRDDAELLREMKDGFPATEEGLRAFLKEVFAYSEERRQKEEQSAEEKPAPVELEGVTNIGGSLTNGDSEGAAYFFAPGAIGEYFHVEARYRPTRMNGAKLKAATLEADVYHGKRLEYFDRDVFFTFCNQGFLNVSNDGRRCMVTLPGLCRALFGSKKISLEEQQLVYDSVLRLGAARIRNINISELEKAGRISKESYSYGAIKATRIIEQAFISFSIEEFIDSRSGNTGIMFTFPSSSTFLIYEIVKDLGRITEYSPILIPGGYRKTTDSYSIFCLFRNRMSWFDPAKPETGRLLFDDFMKPGAAADRSKRFKHRQLMKKILAHWHKIGACSFEFIRETRNGKAVEIGVQLHSTDKSIIFGKPALSLEE